MASFLRYTIWTDANGVSTQTVLRGNADLAAIVTALINHSAGGVSDSAQSVQPLLPVSSPVSAVYGSVADRVALFFATGVGNQVQVTLPCPDQAIFLSDNKTVDPTTITDVITACVGTITDVAGNVVVSYVNGYRLPSGGREYQQ